MDGKCIEQLKKALKAKSDLPVTWECGCDESLICFEGWANQKGGWLRKSNPYGEMLGQLSTRMTELLDLPNAGEVLDQGKGRIFFDPIDDAIKLTYSSTCVLYDLPDELIPEQLHEKEKLELTIEELEAADFKFTCYGESNVGKITAGDFRCKPDVTASVKELLFDKLIPRVPKVGIAYQMKLDGEVEQTVRSIDLELSGNWKLEKKLLTYGYYVRCEVVEAVVEGQTVVLAK